MAHQDLRWLVERCEKHLVVRLIHSWHSKETFSLSHREGGGMTNREEIQNRAAGAIMGAFIGDALALGPHWYYNLDELRRDYGDWIDGYTDPKPGRYHEGLKAGQLS